MKRRRSTLLMLALSLGGCTLAPAYHRPTPAIPTTWPRGEAYAQPGDAALPALRYRDIFGDPRLLAVIDRALANNQDLRVALASVASARAQARVVRAGIFPAIDAAGGGSVVNPSDRTGSSTNSSNRGTTTTYDVSLGTTAFEIDLFGRLRSLSDAAFNEYLGTVAAERSVRLILVSEVAAAWLQLAADRSLLTIAKDTETSAARSVSLTSARLRGGIAPRTDLRQAETVLAQARSDEAALVTAIAQDRNALELLVGGGVADAELPVSIESVDGSIAEVPAGLDSAILLRRPDVVQAEYGLRAANARIGAARAAFFPRISLTALAGFASTALSALFSGGAFEWSVQPSASLPIFDAGATRGGLRYAEAQRDLALAQYRRAIQTAFREVADALARRGTMDRQFAADRQLVAAAQDSLVLGTARYREGIDPYLSTLDAQRTLYSARRTLVSSRLVRARNLVDLYQTLGSDPFDPR